MHLEIGRDEGGDERGSLDADPRAGKNRKCAARGGWLRGGLLRRGLALATATAAAVTNIAEDHLGEFGVADLAALATTKLAVTRGLRPGGTLVLNADDPTLAGLRAYVDDSGEGRWTLQEAIDRAVPMPVLTASLFTRFRSRQDNSFAERMLAALRNQFGGHAVKQA